MKKIDGVDLIMMVFIIAVVWMVTIPFACDSKYHKAEDHSTPLGIVAGQDFSAWTIDSINANGVSLIHQDATTEGLVDETALAAFVKENSSGTFLIRQQDFSFNVPFRTLALPDDQAGPDSIETLFVNSIQYPTAAVDALQDSFQILRNTVTWASVSPDDADSIRIVGSFYVGSTSGTPYFSVMHEPTEEVVAWSDGSLYGGYYTAKFVHGIGFATQRDDIDTTIYMPTNRGDRFLFGMYNSDGATITADYQMQLYGVK